jgi:hypothetical protein
MNGGITYETREDVVPLCSGKTTWNEGNELLVAAQVGWARVRIQGVMLKQSSGRSLTFVPLN